MILRAHSENNFYPETLRKIWDHSEISRESYLAPLGYHAWLGISFFFLHKCDVMSDMFISEYRANSLPGGKSSSLGFGKKHRPKEVNHTHKITGAPVVMEFMNPSVIVL